MHNFNPILICCVVFATTRFGAIFIIHAVLGGLLSLLTVSSCLALPLIRDAMSRFIPPWARAVAGQTSATVAVEALQDASLATPFNSSWSGCQCQWTRS